MNATAKLLLSGIGLMASVASATNNTNAPQVTVKNGTYAGHYSPQYDQDYFLGIPYAKLTALSPAERFALAKSLDSTWDSARDATEFSPNCVSYQIEEQGMQLDEDCLYLNVVRPAGIKEAAKLPVAVWIHGGGLTTGGAAYKRYNMSFIVDQSVEMKRPIIAVSFNYRLNVYGFLSGGEARDAGVTNNGLRDQRLALNWVKENIAAFGGSPDKITIFGESAGAASVTSQVLAYNGRDDGLFRGAIGQSGFGAILPGFSAGLNATKDNDKVYDDLLSDTSCADMVGKSGSLRCLQKLPRKELDHALNVTGVGPFPVVLDDFHQDYPTRQFADGKFVKVPIIIGSNTDEGTGLLSTFIGDGQLINADADMKEATAKKFKDQDTGKSVDEIVDEVAYLYPNIQAVGIPDLKTWPHVIRPNDSFAESLGVQYRRAASFAGDFSMHWLRRRANMIWHQRGLSSWAYRFNIVPNGVEPEVGASHFKEVAFVLHNLNGDGMPIDPFGGDETYVSKARAAATEMSSAWIRFFNTLDPNDNSQRGKSQLRWPKYDTNEGGGVGRELVIELAGNSVEFDDFRAEGINWLMENAMPVLGQ